MAEQKMLIKKNIDFLEIADRSRNLDESVLLDRLFSTRAVKVRYLVIPKCGCTLVKNVFFAIDSGHAYENQRRIHQIDDQMPRALSLGATRSGILNEERAFVNIRNPVDRFASFYFDKVARSGPKNFFDFDSILGFDNRFSPSPRSDREHLINCNILLDWVCENLSGRTDVGINPHWAPQSDHFPIVCSLDLKVLLVDKLTRHLSLILDGVSPRIVSYIKGLERNSTDSKARKDSIFNKDIKRKIRSLYAFDNEFYHAAREEWLKKNPTSYMEIPRWSDVAAR